MDIAFVTSGRADYGILRPVAQYMATHMDVRLIATGEHVTADGKYRQEPFADDGLEVSDTVAMTPEGDTPRDIARAMGAGAYGFADAYARQCPRMLIAVGDRFESLTAVATALPFRIPVAHIHGGELSFGAADEQMRHAMTKMSHLHFVAAEEYRLRVLQLGEEPWRVHNVGAPAISAIKSTALLDRRELQNLLGIDVGPDTLVVTFHPETLSRQTPSEQVRPLLDSLNDWPGTIVVTAANADSGGREINDAMKEFVEGRTNARFFENLGSRVYWSVLSHAAAMAGNSSSGVIEAASFGLPVVNIGHRQDGRLRTSNMIDSQNTEEAISSAIRKATSESFRQTARAAENIYGDGTAPERILAAIRSLPVDADLVMKRFVDFSR